MFRVSSNKVAFILQVLCSQHDIISLRHGGERAHHAQVKGRCAQGATSRPNRLFVTVGRVISLNYTIDVILLRVLLMYAWGAEGLFWVSSVSLHELGEHLQST